MYARLYLATWSGHVIVHMETDIGVGVTLINAYLCEIIRVVSLFFITIHVFVTFCEV